MMHSTKCVEWFVVGVLVFGLASTASAVSLMPMDTVADESGFGTLNTVEFPELTSNFEKVVSGYTMFAGTITSRVYTKNSPITEVTFVWDIAMTDGLQGVESATFSAASVSDPDLSYNAILDHLGLGYVTGTTTVGDGVPSAADVVDNVEIDTLVFGWTLLDLGDRATLYVTTTGAVDVDTINVEFQDFGGASAVAYAPVDDPANPDIGIPEPATLSLMVFAALYMRRRR